MRIRSIRPEFWSSEDVAAMDWHTRLVFIGLWSYVDDNGVGRDVERLIVTALFPLDEDLTEASVRVHGALKRLETGGQITRYMVHGKPFLHIVAWDRNQKVNRPTPGRYPLPTCDNAIMSHSLSEPSVSPPRVLSAGEGEKGRRGEGEKSSKTCASADAEREFDEWYAIYPRKRAKGQAVKAFRTARKKTTQQTLIDTLRQQIPTLIKNGVEFAPYPASWLNGECWNDEVENTTQSARLPHATEIEDPPDGLTPEEYHAWYVKHAQRASA